SERGEIQCGLFGDGEASVAIDELELSDDPPGPRHRDVDDVRRSDRADAPRSAKGMAIDGDRAIGRPGEVAAGSDANVVHRYRFGPGVAQLVHKIRERALVERAVDPDGDPRT